MFDAVEVNIELELAIYIQRKFAKNLLENKNCGNCGAHVKTTGSCAIHANDAFTCLRWFNE